MKRTWYRNQSDRTFFRNTGLIEMDRNRLANKLMPGRYRALSREWAEVFRKGITKAETIPPGDQYINYDDSPEATEAWVQGFLGSHARNPG